MTRNLAVIAVALVVLLLWRLMFVGWRARSARQSDVAAPAAVPEALRRRASDGVEATYVSTTSAGDWLDRITVHGLGARSAARVLVDPVGVLIARTGAPDVFVPVAALREVRRETMRAGKALAGGGLVVVEWQLGELAVATALSPRHEPGALAAAVSALITAGRS